MRNTLTATAIACAIAALLAWSFYGAPAGACPNPSRAEYELHGYDGGYEWDADSAAFGYVTCAEGR